MTFTIQPKLYLIFVFSCLSVICSNILLAQEVDKRLPSMAEEIANLTRQPLGEGTLVFENWIQFTVEEKGRKRSGKLLFSDESTAFIWLEDLNNDKSYFFKSSDDATTITIVPSINQGTELSPAMMTALGYSGIDEEPVKYKMKKGAANVVINNTTCIAATTKHESVEYTMWVGGIKDFKRSDREMLRRGLGFWFKNQPGLTARSAALIEESWIPLGFNFDGYEFRVLAWGTDSELSIIQDEMMVNVLGLDLNSVAKKYVEDIEKEKQKKAALKQAASEGQKED
jgi:hypothetical protein